MNNAAIAAMLSRVMLGAGLLAFVYVLGTPRLFPDVVSTDVVPNGAVGPLRWLVGILIGAVVMMAWYLLRGALRRSRAAR
ncbi:MAG: hypothetical protein Q8L86_10410 [Vicinamibacterales bacterium]|nr:hypothetical protein [Vicinamibacterales bacterium]